MKILIISDQFYAANNGMTISARRFAETLLAHGHTVRVVSTDTDGKAEEFWLQKALNSEEINANVSYIMKKQYIPVFDKLVSSQGMTFAKPDNAKLRKAIQWADIVHLHVPFILSRRAMKIAIEMDKPFTGAFHVQPENITASIHMRHMHLVNKGIYMWFRHYIYKYCEYIHCPSNFIANELVKNGYRSKLTVISNGIDPDFIYRKKEKPEHLKNRFIVLMIGRLSIEKRQDVLIKAVSLSKHKNNITLMLAGQGPRKNALVKLARKKNVDMTVNFYKKEDLLNIIAISDLYVHAADMEIEAMSCMEAFASGLVPVISNSQRSATHQFALDERSLFESGNSRDLAAKIDYWLDNPEERRLMELKYSESALGYRLDDCVKKAENMFQEAISSKSDSIKPLATHKA